MKKNIELKKNIKFGNQELSIETGKIAKQANGTVVVSYGENN
jgi:polyribonucleotide nucleotidyltransferase